MHCRILLFAARNYYSLINTFFSSIRNHSWRFEIESHRVRSFRLSPLLIFFSFDLLFRRYGRVWKEKGNSTQRHRFKFRSQENRVIFIRRSDVFKKFHSPVNRSLMTMFKLSEITIGVKSVAGSFILAPRRRDLAREILINIYYSIIYIWIKRVHLQLLIFARRRTALLFATSEIRIVSPGIVGDMLVEQHRLIHLRSLTRETCKRLSRKEIKCVRRYQWT